MNSDDDFKVPEGDFIPGIYNYCDRWCERCLYTAKCMTFAMEKTMVEEIEAQKRREKSMEENKEFWAQVTKTIEDAADLIDEELPLMNKNDSFLFDDEDNDEDVDEAMKEHEANREKAKNNGLTKAAEKYQEASRLWFKERKEILVQEYNPDTLDFKVSYPGLVNERELNQLTESVDVILWYQNQIYVKIIRALSSYYEEIADGDYFEGFPKDSDGSAMVALMGIDRSIGAWSYLLRTLSPPEKETIKPMVRLLLWLKKELEKQFPEVMNFVWPPKED